MSGLPDALYDRIVELSDEGNDLVEDGDLARLSQPRRS